MRSATFPGLCCLLVLTACGAGTPSPGPSAPTPAEPTPVSVAPAPNAGPLADAAAVQTFSGSLCPVNRPEWVPASTPTCSTHDPVHTVHSFPAVPGVPVFLNAQFIARADYYSDFIHFTARCGSTVLWTRELAGSDGWIHTGPVSIAVSQPCRIDVDVFDFVSAFKANNNRPTQYRIDVTHQP